MNRYEFQISGLSCDHCVHKVENALARISDSVSVDLHSKIATVESNKSVDDILQVLEGVGYPGAIRS